MSGIVKRTSGGLGFAKTHAKRGDPATSAMAALGLFLSGDLGRQQISVLQKIKEIDPTNLGKTAKQIEIAWGGEDARKRLSELEKLGSLYRKGIQRQNPRSGKDAEVWFQTGVGLEELIKRKTMKIDDLCDAVGELVKAAESMHSSVNTFKKAIDRAAEANKALKKEFKGAEVDVLPEDASYSGNFQADAEQKALDAQADEDPKTIETEAWEKAALGAAQQEAATRLNKEQMVLAASTQPAQVQPVPPQMPGMPEMPGAQQAAPAAAVQPQQAAPAQQSNGTMTPPQFQMQVIAMTQRNAVLGTYLPGMLQKYCPPGNTGMHAVPPQYYGQFLQEFTQAEAALNAQAGQGA